MKYGLFLGICLIYLNSAQAQTCYWDGSASADWNDADNWTVDPTGGGLTCVVDGDDYTTAPVISVNSTFAAGLIQVQDAGDLTISADISCTSFIVDQASSTVTLTAGTFTSTGTVRISVGGKLTVTGGTLTAAGQLLHIDDASSTLDIDGGTLSFGTFLIDTDGDVGVTLLDISDGTLTFTGDAQYGDGDNSAGKYNRIAVSGGILTFGGDFYREAGISVKEIDIDLSGGTLLFQGDFTTIMADDALDQTGGILEFEGSKTANFAGTYNATSGTALFDGRTSLTGTGTWNFYHLTINEAADKLSPSVDINVAGDWTNNGALTPGTSKVTFDDGNAQTIGGALETTFYDLTIGKTADNVTLSTSITVNNTLDFNSSGGGSIIIGANNLTIGATGEFAAGSWSITEFIVTNSTGYIRQEGIGATGRALAVSFPVGYNTTNLTHCSVQNFGTDGRFDARSCDKIYLEGSICGGTAITSDAVDVTWEINTNSASPDAQVALNWHAVNQELSGFDNSFCHIVRHNGSVWEATQDNGGSVAGVGGYYAHVTSGITSFSPFGLQDADTPLPVELLEFDAKKRDQVVDIYWKTASEINNEKFFIERSVNGINFVAIEIIAGAGNSNEVIHYNTVDYNPLSGRSYYRLKQEDYDGDYEYSKTVSLQFGHSTQDILIYQDPDKNGVYQILFTEDQEEVLLVLYNSSGTVVYSKVVVIEDGNKSYRFAPGNNIPTGIYLIVGSTANSVFSKKIIIQ